MLFKWISVSQFWFWQNVRLYEMYKLLLLRIRNNNNFWLNDFWPNENVSALEVFRISLLSTLLLKHILMLNYNRVLSLREKLVTLSQNMVTFYSVMGQTQPVTRNSISFNGTGGQTLPFYSYELLTCRWPRDWPPRGSGWPDRRWPAEPGDS